MRCDFCGEEIEGHPFYKDGMCFCSLECSDAMEGGETIPLGEDILDDPEETDEEDYGEKEDEGEDDSSLSLTDDVEDGALDDDRY
jgi:hypothetical protein